MQRTRTTVKLLVCVAVTALSGCVSVTPQQGVPPRPGNSRPAQDLTPQTARPPVHDSLGAEVSAEASEPAPAPSAEARRAAPRPPRQRKQPAPARPRQAPPVVSVPVPRRPAPVTGKGVCALGRGYGHWPAGSPQSRICDDTYGH
ncbi:hypothetical protein [Streptomyces sp. NPDC056061]|uniref:hypothetical protein n=1 Tax=Streptomyces sp. NPDC056061 TaxID=3345700 RepID=UPI0035D8F08F